MGCDILIKIGTDDNIYQVMRFIMPEHRERMEQLDHEAKKRSQRELSEDDCAEFQYLFSEAAAVKRKIKLRLFDPWHSEEWVGIPVISHHQPALLTDDGIKMIPMLKVESMTYA